MFRNESALLLGECNLWNEEHDEFFLCVSLGGYPLYEKGTDEGLSTASVQCSDHISMNGPLENFLLISAWYQSIITESRRLCSH